MGLATLSAGRQARMRPLLLLPLVLLGCSAPSHTVTPKEPVTTPSTPSASPDAGPARLKPRSETVVDTRFGQPVSRAAVDGSCSSNIASTE